MPFCRSSGEYCCVGYKMHPVEKICVRKLSVELKKKFIAYFSCFGWFINMWCIKKTFNISLYFQIYNYYHLACEPGYSGVNCKLKCPFPLYGSECQMRCTCKAEHCDFANGCKSSYGIFITVINVLFRFLIKAKRYLWTVNDKQNLFFTVHY